MKHKFLRMLSLGLVALMLLTVFASCAKSDEETGSDGTELILGEDTTQKNAFEASGLEKRTFDGKEMNIWYCTEGGWAPGPMAVTSEEYATGDVIKQAGYNRNVYLQEEFDLTLNFIPNAINASGSGAGDALEELRGLYNSGDSDKLDMVVANARACGILAQEGFYYDLNESEYIHSDSFYYEAQMNEQVEYFGKQYFASGYFNTQNTTALSVMFVNYGILESISQGYITLDTLYKKALDHTWTFEYMLTSGKDYATPLQNEGDNWKTNKYSLIVSSGYDFPLYYDLGGTILEYDNNQGTYVCTVQDTKNQDLLTYLQTVLGMNADVGILTNDSPGPNGLKAGAAPYVYGTFYYLQFFTDATVKWTTMPSPLYEEGEDYRSFSASGNLNFAGIPTNCADTDKASYLYEVFMAYSYDYVYPAYYEKCFQTRYQPTSESAQVFDIIAGSRVVCMAEIFRLYSDTSIKKMIGYDLDPIGSGTTVIADTVNAAMEQKGWK